MYGPAASDFDTSYSDGKPYASNHLEGPYGGGRRGGNVPPGRRVGLLEQPLRVVHVGPDLLRGGAEQWLLDLLRFLDPRRVRIVRHVVPQATEVDPSYVADLPIPVEIGEGESLRRAARTCDVLLTWGVGLNRHLADCRPKLCIVVAHGEGEWTRVRLEDSNQVLDHVVAVSWAVKQRVCAAYPTTVIYNGVDAGRLACSRSRQEVRASLGFGPNDFVLGYVGRFAGEKRVPVIVEAVAQLPPRFKALLIGWGRQRVPLMEMANDLIPCRYAFVTAHKNLGDYYQAMDAVCLVSDQEGFPLVMLEAMLCSRPLIVTPVGCVPEVVRDRVNGVIVAGDPTSVAKAAELLDRHPRWAEGLAAEGKAFAERYGHARRMARDYEVLLQGLWRAKFGSASPLLPS
jgi:glycosyltransferase involved in cell wall biosynthesis